MKRVLIIGIPGAGKSTLARRLAEPVGLPVIHLDQLLWRSGWTQRSEGDYRRDEAAALASYRWIIEGNYASTLARRIERADTIIYLDFPLHLCLWRIFKRTCCTYGKTRADMAEGCPERFDGEFLRYVVRFRRDVRPQVEAILENTDGVNLVRVTSPAEVERWLQMRSTATP